jgi:error-prone DNA polymerase
MSDYAELHASTAFSFLRGATPPEELAHVAAERGLGAVAVCDRNGLYGSARFTRAAVERGVQPIVGSELTMEDGSVLPVLVENRRGYTNLCTLLSTAHLRAEKGESAIAWSELPEFADGLVALWGASHAPRSQTPFGNALVGATLLPADGASAGRHRRQNTPAVRSRALLPSAFPNGGWERGIRQAASGSALPQLLRAFGPRNVFIELQRHRVRGENRGVRELVALAEEHRLPILATNGVQYATPTARPLCDAFTCLRHHTHLDEAGLLLSPNAERHLKTPAEMRELFHDLPEAITNTVRLSERLEFRLGSLGYSFPCYHAPDGSTQEAFLRRVATEGAHRRYGPTIPVKVRQQMDHELRIIENLKFAGYFLIVWDIVNFCRQENIMVQGRGSAANSAVCYCLGITAVDAVKHELLFERFLSEGRKSWPDIDLDLPSGDRRERVIQEVYRRYGRFGAAMTANVITYRGRSAAREIGKVLNFPENLLDRFSALFANGDFPHTLELRGQLEQAGFPAEHPRLPAFVALYQMIRGLPRHLGQHSGGMIICQDKLGAFVPLENASMPGRSVAQWDKEDCEELGIIKVDLLGLGMMSVLQDSVELCAQRGRQWCAHPAGEKADCHDLLAAIPQDDAATYDLMCRADTIGVFQIESRAQMATLPRMKPRNFYDLAIEIAIIRPGPIQGGLMHPYLRRRAGEEPIIYVDDRLEPVLRRTLGVPLFQEQILQMAMTMADFTGSEAEELRRAVSFHRSQERMAKVVVKLRHNMTAKGVPAEQQEQIIAAIQSFALYGFPESHALSFALLAYASAWLKVHRAEDFFTSLLNNQPMGFYSADTLIKDAKRHGVKTRPVCLERSEWFCTIEENGVSSAIRLGFCIVRGLSEAHARALLAARPFSSLDDLKTRVPLDKDELRVLAEVGALNALAPHRRAALWEAERELLPTDDLFAARIAEDPLPTQSPLAPMTPAERLQADYRGTGLSTGPHAMALVRAQLPDVWRAIDLPRAANGLRVRIAGAVICRQRPGTAKGFVFISLEDETGVANAIVTPPMFERHRLCIVHEPFLVIDGILQNHQGVIHVRAETIAALDQSQLATAGSHDFH